MSNAGAFIVAGDSLVVVINGKNYTVNKSSSHYNRVKDAVVCQDWDKALHYLEQATSLMGEIWWNDQECRVYYGQEPLHHSLADRIPRMLDEGFDTAPMVAFLKNLFYNPAPHAIEELYEFLEKNALPITEDGCFLAYKKVREDYTDVHTGTFDNSIGKVIEMDRDLCDPVRENHCSTGFHFCGLSYLTCFGGEKVMIVKINPSDVTSIPNDYDYAKGRCCTYVVVDEYTGTDVPRLDVFSSSVAPADFDDAEYPEEIEGWDQDSDDNDCDCEIVEEEEKEEANLFYKQEAELVTNPITNARIQAGLQAQEVADALEMPLSAYLNRIEVEGRFFKASTIGRLHEVIKSLKK